MSEYIFEATFFCHQSSLVGSQSLTRTVNTQIFRLSTKTSIGFLEWGKKYFYEDNLNAFFTSYEKVKYYFQQEVTKDHVYV